MAHNEPPHQDLRCLRIQLFLSLVLKELINREQKEYLDSSRVAAAASTCIPVISYVDKH